MIFKCAKLKTILSRLLLFLLITAACGCYPALKREAQRPQEALTRVRFFYPEFRDDMDIQSLALAIQRNREYLTRLDPGKIFYYGQDRFTCAQVRRSQEAFLDLIRTHPSPDLWTRQIREHFRVYRAAGHAGDEKILFTGYFIPTFEASLIPDERFKYPIYRQPQDLVRIDLSPFKKRFEGESIVARVRGKEVLPYYSRFQIEEEGALKGRHLEIAWLKDPIDVAFLHIQGSGRLQLPNGDSITVGYKTSNGRPYHSIGRYMLEHGLMTPEKMSMQGIRKYLSDHPELKDEVLNYNPSYVFFRVLDNGPIGNISVPLTPGRSLAADSMLFPKGALAFIACKKPVLNREGQITAWKKFSRFVLVQDTGGAIKGAGRADLFWGMGPYEELAAGHMQHEGKLYILIKKPEK